MRSSKDIEQSLKHADLDVEINAETDRAIMGELTRLHRNAGPCYPSGRQLGYTALAAAAAIIIVIGLVFFRREASVPEETPRPAVAMSAAEMLTIGRLKAAYRRGGLEAFEAQCDDAAEKMDVTSEPLSVRDLIAEIEGI